MKKSELKKLIREEVKIFKEVTNPKFSSKLASCCMGKLLMSSYSLDDLNQFSKRHLKSSMIDFIKYSDKPEIYSVWIGGKLNPNYRVIRDGRRYRLEFIGLQRA